MTLWMVALLFIGLGWWRIASTRQMSPVVVPGVTLATVLALGSTIGHYDRALSLLAMVGAVSVMRGQQRLADVWAKLQPVLACAILLASASEWPKSWYCNIYASWLLLLYPAGWFPLIVSGLALTRSTSAMAGLAVAWLSRWPRVVVIGIPMICLLAVALKPVAFQVRVSIWAEAIRLWSERPLFGWGTSAYYMSLTNDLGMVRSTGLGHAHNALLTVAAENGAVGVAAMLWLVYRMWQQAGSNVGLLAFGFHQLLDDTWLDPLSAVLLGLWIGSSETTQEVEHVIPS
jgi:O-antigen ligase